MYTYPLIEKIIWNKKTYLKFDFFELLFFFHLFELFVEDSKIKFFLYWQGKLFFFFFFSRYKQY